jgi:hypothetical protein
MKVDMIYDGQTVRWSGHGNFKATSGLPEYQRPSLQCYRDHGPIPEGLYSVTLEEDTRPARDDGTDTCTLAWALRVQTIPRGAAAGQCEPFWANWGSNRVAVVPADAATKARCAPRRGGFFLHDSTKGYTHGCIEVDGQFFRVLRSYISGIKQHRISAKHALILRVTYVPGRSTNGGTARE